MKQTIKLQLDKWVNNGFTLGYSEGKPIFVLGGIPGEEVECELIEQNRKLTSAIVVQVIKQSPLRINPPCPIYLKCGGCSFQHIPYVEELKIKENLLRLGMQYVGLEINSLQINIHIATDYNYRNNVQVKINENLLGFYKIKSNNIVELPESGCLLLEDDLNKYIVNHPHKIPQDGKLRIDSSGVYPYGTQKGNFKIHGKSLVIPSDGFYQINSKLLDNWIDRILYHSEKDNDILELFCGSGTISLFLAEFHNKITGFEISEKSIQTAKINLKDYSNATFFRKDLYATSLQKVYKNDYICIANPPRAGLGKLVKKFILSDKPSKLIYSSCNYTTLIPDLKDLTPHYNLSNIEILDFFPRTPYFETLVVLEKKV